MDHPMQIQTCKTLIITFILIIMFSQICFPAELPEKSERIRAIYQKVDELPESNYSTLERLIFHLVK
jgi:hypothetical protein